MISYSPRRADLYTPARDTIFFPSGLYRSDAAMCAELSRLAYCREEGGFHLDQSRITKILQAVGFSGTRFFESDGLPEGRGTHCFIAQRAASSGASELNVVAFRGTDADDPTDLTADANFLFGQWKQGGRAHRGFIERYGDVSDGLEPVVNAMTGRVVFTGHSLGAALATLLATVRKPDLLCTIGSPRVGDGAFVTLLEGVANLRYVDCCDIVARIPPPVEYKHFGDPYYIAADRSITFNPREITMDRDRIRAAAEYLVEYALKPGNLKVRELADHSAINYVLPIAAAEKELAEAAGK